MNFRYTLFGAVTALAFGASAAQGQVAVGGTLIGLNDADGLIPEAPSRVIAVVDQDGDGLAGFDLANYDGSSFLADLDDVIVTDEVSGNGAFDVTTGGVFDNNTLVVSTTEFQINLADANEPTNTGAGDSVFLFYFIGLETSALAPGQGVSFGVVEVGQLDTVGGVNFFNADLGAVAEFTTIPEPASLVLVGLGAVAMFSRRRRSA